jgi:integrase
MDADSGRRGSEKQSKNGSWYLVIPAGAMKRAQTRRRAFATRRAAQSALTRTLRDLTDQTYVAPVRQMFGITSSPLAAGDQTQHLPQLRPQHPDPRDFESDCGWPRCSRSRRPCSTRCTRTPPRARPSEQMRARTWTGEQIARFLDATADSRYSPLWRLIATTGLRRGESLGLRWDGHGPGRGTPFGQPHARPGRRLPGPRHRHGLGDT